MFTAVLSGTHQSLHLLPVMVQLLSTICLMFLLRWYKWPLSTHRQRRTSPAAAITTAPTRDHHSCCCLPHFLLWFLFVLPSHHVYFFSFSSSLWSLVELSATFYVFISIVSVYIVIYFDITSLAPFSQCMYLTRQSVNCYQRWRRAYRMNRWLKEQQKRPFPKWNDSFHGLKCMEMWFP